jgi:hypothetical protein
MLETSDGGHVSDFLEYAFRIIEAKPETISMARLAIYMAEFARLLGHPDEVHFSRIVDGSVGIIARVLAEDVAVISPRVRDAARGLFDADGMSAFKKLNDYLGEDGWTAELPLPRGGEVIIFPGTKKSSKAIRIVNQHTSVQGRLVRIEGSGDLVKVGLDIDGDLVARIAVNAVHAKELAQLFHQHVRISGDGRWKRDAEGKWLLDNLNATSFEALEDVPLADTLSRLKEILPSGSGESILKAVDGLRSA